MGEDILETRVIIQYMDQNETLEISDENAVQNPMRKLLDNYIRYEWRAVFLGIFGSIFSRILDLIPPLLLAVALDSVILNEKQFELFLVPNSYLPVDRYEQLILVVLLILSSFLTAAVFHWIRNWGWNALAQRVQHDIREDAYDSIQRLGMRFFAEHQTGEIMSVLSNDANQLEKFLNEGMNATFRIGVMVLGIGGILIYLNWQLALVALSVIPILMVFTYIFIRSIQPKYEEVRSSVGDLNSRLENNLSGMKIIKINTTEDYESSRVSDKSKSYLKSQWDAITTRIKFFPALRLLSGFGFTLTFVIGGYWVIFGSPPVLTGDLSPGEFVVFVLYTQRFIWPVAQFGQIINKYQRARASAKRLTTLIEQDPNVYETDNSVQMDDLDGDIEYNNVTFGYRDGEETINNVSFEVSEGDTVALVGPTGAGKSTIIKLLMRLYSPDSGAVSIGNEDISNININQLRSDIGYVSQDPFLFEGTVKDNIVYGTTNSTEEDIKKSAKMAEAHNFVQSLPEEYDTIVGERGVKLSGGQRQRIAIARSVIDNPSMMILDEATSDVDTKTELLIQKSLNKLTQDITTIVIAHRLSTVKNADKIIVIEDGKVTEKGNHNELIEKDGLYADLWRVQSGDIDKVSEEFVEKASSDDIDKIESLNPDEQ